MATNPLDFPRYVRSLRPSLPESLPNFVEDELEKVSKSLQELEEATSNFANARVEEERIVRINADESLAARIVTVSTDFDAANSDTVARIASEEIARASADEAISSRVDTVEADFVAADTTTNARVTTEELARATSDEALAARIDTVVSEFQTTAADITSLATTEVYTRSTADSALSTRIDTVSAAYAAADAVITASVTTEATARASADASLATSISTLTANYIAADSTIAASVTTEATARASADTALSSSVSTLSTTVGGHTATLSTHGSSIGGLEAKYGVTLDVNNYITGFSQNNSGTTGDFIVKADTFKVVMPGEVAITPFAVTAGGVEINGDLVVNGTIQTNQIGANAVTDPASVTGSVVTWTAATNTVLTEYTSASLTKSFSGVAGSQAVVFMTGKVSISFTSVASIPGSVVLRRDGVNIAIWQFIATGGSTSTFHVNTVFNVDVPTTGSHTYTAVAIIGTETSGTNTGVFSANIHYQETKR